MGFSFTPFPAPESDGGWCFHREPAGVRFTGRDVQETWRGPQLSARLSRRDKTGANVAATSFRVQPLSTPHQTLSTAASVNTREGSASDSRKDRMAPAAAQNNTTPGPNGCPEVPVGPIFLPRHKSGSGKIRFSGKTQGNTSPDQEGRFPAMERKRSTGVRWGSCDRMG